MNSKFERGTPYEIRNIQRPTTMKWQRYTPSPDPPTGPHLAGQGNDGGTALVRG